MKSDCSLTYIVGCNGIKVNYSVINACFKVKNKYFLLNGDFIAIYKTFDLKLKSNFSVEKSTVFKKNL